MTIQNYKKNVISEVILSVVGVNHLIDREILKDSTLSIDEFYQLAIDAIAYSIYYDDEIDNYIYYWISTDDPENYWRMSINPELLVKISEIIHEIKNILKIDKPAVLNLLVNNETNCNVYASHHYVVLSF